MKLIRTIIYLSLPISAVLLVSSCKKDSIQTFAPEDSAVVFRAPTNSFSFKGMTEEYRDLDIVVNLIGYCADYDREFKVESEDSTAVLGRDFTIVSSVMKAGAVRGFLTLRVNHLPEGVDRQDVRFRIVPNEHFRAGPPNATVANVGWSEAYERPAADIYRGWYNYFCHGYSRELHRQLVTFFGEEIETYVMSQAPAKENPELEFKLITWWYSASREFRAWIKARDDANPGNPLRHSDDYEEYRTYTTATGAGSKPEVIPTILETLNVL